MSNIKVVLFCGKHTQQVNEQMEKYINENSITSIVSTNLKIMSDKLGNSHILVLLVCEVSRHE